MRSGLQRRAQRALERQLDYQRRKAEGLRGLEAEIIAGMAERSARIRDTLQSVRALPDKARVIEVGSGAHGLIFFFDAADKVGIDPLADQYRELFPAWQGRAQTIAAFGEQLPFPDESFDLVLSDNVVDHAENPRAIIEEMVRVLAPGGLLYFTVNVHHSLYHWAASIHAGWRAIGVPFEIGPFADHTVHLTLRSAKALFDGLPLRILREEDSVAATKRAARTEPRRHLGDLLKRLFFKNAVYEVIAVKAGDLAPTTAAP